MASQSSLDCSEAAGDVSSMYSTPNASSAFAIAILVLVSKNALANCSPSIGRQRCQFTGMYEWEDVKPRSVLSMMLKFEMLERKSEARGAYGLRCWSEVGLLAARDVPRLPLASTPLGLTPLVRGIGTMSVLSATGVESPLAWGHIVEQGIWVVVAAIRKFVMI
jgi:hypothetical protein